MEKGEPFVLTINAGSSSIKFSFRPLNAPHTCSLKGMVDRIGFPGTYLEFFEGEQYGRLDFPADSSRAIVENLMDWLSQQAPFPQTVAVGHRIVHGMNYVQHQPATHEVLEVLHSISQFDPQHLPMEIRIIETLRQRYPVVFQVACFDTAFHAQMPKVAQLLPIPRRFYGQGVRRYGFHGLSYMYLMEELAWTAGKEVAAKKTVLAHLGNGVSLAAVRGGHSVDTSMSFTPCGGVPMSTRSGDIDPGLAWFITQTEHLSVEQFHEIVNRQSGLLGISETSSDMRDLLNRRRTDVRAAEAIELFCYQIKKCIGAFVAVLNGLDTLVFSGGIGERASEIRSAICNELTFLGISLDPAANAQNAAVISPQGNRVTVRVIPTDEEQMIARITSRLLQKHGQREIVHG